MKLLLTLTNLALQEVLVPLSPFNVVLQVCFCTVLTTE